MRRLLLLPLIPVALLISGCSSTSAALDECVEVVAEHFSVDAGDVTVTDTVESPAGAYDWEGTASDGTFACASPDGGRLTTALAFDATGFPTTLVVR